MDMSRLQNFSWIVGPRLVRVKKYSGVVLSLYCDLFFLQSNFSPPGEHARG